ncbi:MAG: hypothetical protein H8J66_06150 [Nitrospira sp.]|nr:hypothetical protein [Nitrospira sp.]
MHNVLHTVAHQLVPMLIRVWVMLWVLSVPLFHVHPEFAERSGQEGAMRSGTVHTVFSADLDGEFDIHEASTHSAADKSVHLSHTWFEHSELGFSLLTDSHHRVELKPILVQTMALPDGKVAIIPCHEQATERLAVIPSSTLFVHQLPSRAPPSLLL